MPEESFLNAVWKQRELGLSLTSANLYARPSTHDDVEYLCDNVYPFLQLVNTAASFGTTVTLNLLTATTGWIIHDYGDAISTSAPHDIPVKKSEDEKGDGGKEGGEGGGSGTMSLQQIITAAEIIELIKQKGWPAVELIAGSKKMQRFLWIAAQEKNIKVNGFSPTQEDEKCLARIKARKAAIAKITVPKTLAPQNTK